ncbi:hypothetical protein ASE76_18435 [Xylophilus sp. Leaf220]|nr:hypothetical protein ASE76_18435 [Xylophilus sp. Leaf220]
MTWIKSSTHFKSDSMPRTPALRRRKTPTRKAVVRSVASSTAVETGQSISQLEHRLEQPRARFSHIKLAR